MTKSTRTRIKTERWTDGSNFLFKGTTESKTMKTDRRLTMTPKKALEQGMKNRRTSVMLMLDTDAKAPSNVRRSRRQSMVNLNKDTKKTISRATSEKVLPKSKMAAKRTVQKFSPIKEAEVKIRSTGARSITRSHNVSSLAKRKSMSEMITIIPEERAVRSSAKKSTKKQASSKTLLDSIASTNLVTARRGKGRAQTAKESQTKPSIKGSAKKTKKAGRTPVSSRKMPASKKVAATPPEINSMEVQLAIATAVGASAKNKVKRLDTSASGSRSLRSSRKVKLMVESPPRAKNSTKRAGSYLDNDSPMLQMSMKSRNLKPFTPKPENPYDIMKSNMRKRVTNKIDLMHMSPERVPPSPSSFCSLASTPSSSWNLPPTPKSSRSKMLESFVRIERKSLRTFRRDDRPVSSTPKKGSSLQNNSAYLSMDEEMDSSVEVSCNDSPDGPAIIPAEVANCDKSESKKGYCSVM